MHLRSCQERITYKVFKEPAFISLWSETTAQRFEDHPKYAEHAYPNLLTNNTTLISLQNTITSTLELFGEPNGYIAMFKGVGVTCDIAAQMILDGFATLSQPGILAPYSREIRDAIRAKVETKSIKLVEEML